MWRWNNVITASGFIPAIWSPAQQSVRTGRDGVVKAVHVRPMDSVSANDPLVELE